MCVDIGGDNEYEPHEVNIKNEIIYPIIMWIIIFIIISAWIYFVR